EHGVWWSLGGGVGGGKRLNEQEKAPLLPQDGEAQCQAHGDVRRAQLTPSFKERSNESPRLPRPRQEGARGAPAEAILEGRQPRPLGIRLLLQGIPLARTDQHAAFGFSHQIEKQAAKLIRPLMP